MSSSDKIQDFIEHTQNNVKETPALALIGTKDKTDKMINELIDTFGEKNCFIIDDNKVSTMMNSFDDITDRTKLWIEEENIFKKPLVIFKLNFYTLIDGYFVKLFKSIVSGDKIACLRKKEIHEIDDEDPNDDGLTYHYPHLDFKNSNFVISMTKKTYEMIDDKSIYYRLNTVNL